MDVVSSVVIDGHTLCKGISCYDDDEDADENDVKYWVYEPGTDSWFKIECNDDPIFYNDKYDDKLHVINNTCYLLSYHKTCVNGKKKNCRKACRLTCDFESEHAMLTAEEVDPAELGVDCLLLSKRSISHI